jgi:hypothetical protein
MVVRDAPMGGTDAFLMYCLHSWDCPKEEEERGALKKYLKKSILNR